jgi:acetyl esterase/lipase
MHSFAVSGRALATGLLTLTALGAALAAPDAETVRLWSGKAPGEQGAIPPEKQDAAPNGAIRTLTNVVDPTLVLYRPEHPNGTSIIIAPGGAYRFLSWDHEGVQVAHKFNQAGVTAFVLKYRVPTREFDPENKLALMDAQRAVSLVRSRAGEWGLKADKVGFLGFSAGGHLGANLSNTYTTRAYSAADDVDKTSARPDYVVLIYPGGMLMPNSTELTANCRPSASTPPTFVAVAADDNGSSPASIRYWEAVKDAGVKSELHVYTSGGHGFGMRASAGVASTWPDRAVEWMRGIGMAPAAP